MTEPITFRLLCSRNNIHVCIIYSLTRMSEASTCHRNTGHSGEMNDELWICELSVWCKVQQTEEAKKKTKHFRSERTKKKKKFHSRPNELYLISQWSAKNHMVSVFDAHTDYSSVCWLCVSSECWQCGTHNKYIIRLRILSFGPKCVYFRNFNYQKMLSMLISILYAHFIEIVCHFRFTITYSR